MDEFILPIDKEKFRLTNGPWNNLMLNDPWSVGYVTTLIELQEFTNKKDWETAYYQSGTERNQLLSKLLEQDRIVLNDEALILKNKLIVGQLSWPLKNLNFQYGRTREQLQKKAEMLYQSVKNNGSSITLQECFECVRFRVICETWNGVIIRERNTVATLNRLFPNNEYRKVPGEIDFQYAIDYEVYKEQKLAYAIQIKPESYQKNMPYILKARAANKHENQMYFAKFKAPVYDVISNSKGFIINQEVLAHL